MSDTPKRHAPRGPVKARAVDPMDPNDPTKRRCTATNRSGSRCGRYPILGGTVCRMHGGAAPQVKQKALERLTAYQDRAIDRLFTLVEQTNFPSTSMAAVKDVLDRTMGKPAESVAVQHSGKIVVEWSE